MSSDSETAQRQSPANLELVGDETHALRNPLKAMQPKRNRKYMPKSDAQKLVLEERQKRRREQALALESEIQDIHRECNSRIEEIARKYSKKSEDIRNSVYHVSAFKQQRKINLFNAEVSMKAHELRSSDPGVSYPIAKVQEIVLQERAQREENGETLSKEDEMNLIRFVGEQRQLKSYGTRPSNKSAAMDVYNTGVRVTMELKKLQERSGAAGFMAIARGHLNDVFPPTVYETSNAAGFCGQSLGFNPADVGGRLECHQSAHDTKSLRKECVKLISDGLQDLTGRKDIAMNYNNYDTAIVARYRIKLVGWPKDVPFLNPSKMSTVDQLRRLRDALTSGKCFWGVMNREEVESHSAQLESIRAEGGTVGVPRKTRSDKNKKRKHVGDEGVLDNGLPSRARQASRASKIARHLPPIQISPEFYESDSEGGDEEISIPATALAATSAANLLATTNSPASDNQFAFDNQPDAPPDALTNIPPQTFATNQTNAANPNASPIAGQNVIITPLPNSVDAPDDNFTASPPQALATNQTNAVNLNVSPIADQNVIITPLPNSVDAPDDDFTASTIPPISQIGILHSPMIAGEPLCTIPPDVAEESASSNNRRSSRLKGKRVRVT